ncbi:MAG: class I SAM-dependent methyltransferase [Comamonadaceae bacterium]|nr:MAG: class I SAM-dependent methyltransferase [Comamonadaceae bacterium]
MNTKTLRELYEHHEGKISDKWSSYLSEYDRLFSRFQNEPIRLLEIGIQNGGSLEIWSKYFSKAKNIVGCDINPNCTQLTYSGSNIKVVVGDANTAEIEEKILDIEQKFDVIIDDGSHRSGDIASSFFRYFPHLNNGGIFVVEDLHCSYWREFEGGLFDSFSSMSFFKRLVDIINFEHWALPLQRADLLQEFAVRYGFAPSEDTLSSIFSVEMLNSICVIRKEHPKLNALGRRVVAGNEAIIDQIELKKANGMHHSPIPQVTAAYPEVPILPELEMDQLRITSIVMTEERQARDAEIHSLEDALARSKAKMEVNTRSLLDARADLAAAAAKIKNLLDVNAACKIECTRNENELSAIRKTISWRLTAPLRGIRRAFNTRRVL